MALSSWIVPLLLHAVTLNPPTVPARGYAETVATLDRAQMVRLRAKSPGGTWCQVVDQVRGPFAQSGAIGRANCELDLLLDQGQYKLRLQSPNKGKGNVQLQLVPFVELNPRPVRLVPGARVDGTLQSGQQASYWLRLDGRSTPYLRVVGRTAGQVRLWRNGEWLEEVPLRSAKVQPVPGKALWEWWLDAPVDAGDYLVTVYGTDEVRWASGGETDALEVALGFPRGAVDRQASFTLPPSGLWTLQLGMAEAVALLNLKDPPQGPVDLQLLAWDGQSPLNRYASQCRVEKKQLIPDCAAWGPGYRDTVVVVRGPPGTKGSLSWSRWGYTAGWTGGYYGAPTQQLGVYAPQGGGNYLLALHDLPADADAAPLGCHLEETWPNQKPRVVARDVLRLDEGSMLDREFNYDGNGAFVWFELTHPARLRVAAKGDRKSRCELFRVDRQSGDLERLSKTAVEAKTCDESFNLPPGVYQVSLYGGLPGVERLVVKEETGRPLTPVPAKAGCVLPNVPLTSNGPSYRLVANRTGAVKARGLVAERLPLALTSPLHLILDPGQKLTLPLQGPAASGLGTVAVRGAGLRCGAGEQLTDARDGECRVDLGQGSITVHNPTRAVVPATLFRPTPPPVPPALVAWNPQARPPLRVPLDTPTFFDFDREESHSMVFDVEQAGLYHVTTQGLLATACRMRTPVVTSVAQDTRGGRGRNCLLAGYLRPGRYMLTVGTVGQSRGRGAVLMTRRAPKEQAQVATGGEAYFRVEAGDLVQQKLSIRKAGRQTLSTAAQGVGVQCRLDDPQGWPVEPVPSACVGTRRFSKGTYLWTQLPLTVESMRRTRLEPVKPPRVLKGNKPHTLEFFTWYQAALGKDGKDELLFTLEGPTEVGVVLTDGMQARVELLETDKPPRVVELIPPTQEEPPPSGEEGEGEASSYESGEGELADGPPQDSVEGGEGDGEGGGEGYEGEPPPAPYRQPQARQVPLGPTGVKVSLGAGKYRLLAEHSRGDVAVSYRVHLGASVLMPGMAREVPVPSRLAVSVPRDGTLRLRTAGEADVRCRLFDARGRLVFETSENGADWNCVAAEPVPKGDYTLVVESETESQGETRLALALATVEERPAAASAQTFELARAVLRVAVPRAEADGVQELTFTSKAPFSCGLEAPDGQVTYRGPRDTHCSLLVRPKSEPWKVRLWTVDGVAKVTFDVRTRPLGPSDGKSALAAGRAGTVRVDVPGRYRTAPGAFCLDAGKTGRLEPCGPEASLPAGTYVISGAGEAPLVLALEPKLSNVAAATQRTLEQLSTRPAYDSLQAPGASVFLLEARTQYGERASPACAFEGQGSVREGRDAACFAASAVGTRAVARTWSPVPPELPVAAEVVRRAVALPPKAEPLALGHRALAWRGEAALFAFPEGARARAELVLPRDTWAVLLTPQGQAQDLCAPAAAAMRRCTLSGKGHRLLLVGGEGRADLQLVRLDTPERTVRFAGLYEDAPRAPGTLVLDVAEAGQDRVALVEGALRCVVALSGGERVASCRAEVPRGQAARLELEHGPQPFRVAVFEPGRDLWARLALGPPGAKPPVALEPSTLGPLSGTTVERTLTLERDAVVRLAADSGVCGLFRGSDLVAMDGLGAGCEVVRLLGKGTYRAAVRSFGEAPLQGGLQWTAEPISRLGEGVADEQWIAPGEVRLFRFDTAGAGKVGLGLQAAMDSLDCAVFDDAHRALGDGCQQYLQLPQGRYLLTVRLRNTASQEPLRFRPVLLGLSGTQEEIPEDYLQNLLGRQGVAP